MCFCDVASGRLGKIRLLLTGTESVPELPIISSDTLSLNYMRLVKAKPLN